MYKFTVLLVDDEIDFLETTAKQLKRRDIEAKTAVSGRAALEILNASAVDVVLLDVKMPEMDGIETLEKIRSQHPLVEVVLLTGHASVDSGVSGMKLGAFDYLMKPTAIETLIEKLSQAYQKRRIQLEKVEQEQTRKFMAMPT